MPFLVALPFLTPARPARAGCAPTARASTTRRSNVTHRSRHVRHQNRLFSPLPAPSVSVGPLQTMYMHIFDVNKCTYLCRQLPPLPSATPKPVQFMGKCGEVRHLSRPPFPFLRPPSFVF
jgi:hypothetical protein